MGGPTPEGKKTGVIEVLGMDVLTHGTDERDPDSVAVRSDKLAVGVLLDAVLGNDGKRNVDKERSPRAEGGDNEEDPGELEGVVSVWVTFVFCGMVTRAGVTPRVSVLRSRLTIWVKRAWVHMAMSEGIKATRAKAAAKGLRIRPLAMLLSALRMTPPLASEPK